METVTMVNGTPTEDRCGVRTKTPGKTKMIQDISVSSNC